MKNIQLVRLTSGEEIIADVDLNGIDTDTVILKVHNIITLQYYNTNIILRLSNIFTFNILLHK